MNIVVCTHGFPLEVAVGEEHGPWPWLGMCLESFFIGQQMIYMKFSTSSDGLCSRAILMTNPIAFSGPIGCFPGRPLEQPP